MKIILVNFCRLSFTFSTLFFISSTLQAQSDVTWTQEKATKWYDSKVWLNGLSANPYEVVDKLEFAKQYHANKAYWDKAFAYLKNTDFSKLEKGKYPIDGENVFATVSEGPTRDVSKSKWESHRNYNDIHYVIKGKEKIGIIPVSQAKVTEEYNQEKDIAFYTADNGKFYLAQPDAFFIVTTKDAHDPSIKVEGNDVVKKIVIKVRNSSK